mgnify:CR=1 FL=1
MTETKTDNIVPLIGGKCPMCGKNCIQEFRPFCSKRCADLDLGRWFNEDYRLPEEEASTFDDHPFAED